MANGLKINLGAIGDALTYPLEQELSSTYTDPVANPSNAMGSEASSDTEGDSEIDSSTDQKTGTTTRGKSEAPAQGEPGSIYEQWMIREMLCPKLSMEVIENQNIEMITLENPAIVKISENT